MEQFLDELDRIYEQSTPILFANVPMKPVDATTKQRMMMNKKCVICFKPLGKEKHLDYNHYTGEALGMPILYVTWSVKKHPNILS